MSDTSDALKLDAKRPYMPGEVMSLSRAEIWLVPALVLAYVFLFWMASGRGYEFFDEAYDLLTISDPSRYPATLTDFGYVWNPLYRAVHGSIAWFRVAGFIILSGCAALFGFMVCRVVRDRTIPLVTVLGIFVAIAWQYPTWKPTPDYNMLNICGLLLYFGGLLSVVQRPGATTPTNFFRHVFLPSILCGLGITVSVLAKPTSAAIACILGLVWIVLLPPRKPFACLGTTIAVALILITGTMLAIGGTIHGYVDQKLEALRLLMPADGSHDFHGIGMSVIAPLSKPLWQIAEGAGIALIVFGTSVSWAWLLIKGVNGQRLWAANALSVWVAVLLTWWRAQDVALVQVFMGYHLWGLLIPMMFAGMASILLWFRKPLADGQKAAVRAACILALAPFAYSFGTGSVLILHMAGASIFWVAAMMLLATAAPRGRSAEWRCGIAFTTCVTAIALFAGMAITPGRIGAPLWKQAKLVQIGSSGTPVAVDPATAEYMAAFQRSAHAGGFASGTPVIDVSETGLGTAFALGAKPVGAFPWLVSEGGLARESDRRATIAVQAEAVPKFLAKIPASQLRRAWIITGSPDYLGMIGLALRRSGLNFPRSYKAVATATRPDYGWTQTLWRPTNVQISVRK